MCLIVDANCFSHVFNKQDQKHPAYEPVYNWLFTGHGGGLVYGGDKYSEEVDFKTSRYRPLIAELERKGRLFPVCGKCVNEIAEELRATVQDEDFDDAHILALVIVSRCRVVCTDDLRSIPFLKRADLYPDGVRAPLIYQSGRNANLCRDASNIADVCRTKADTCRRPHEAR